MDIHLGTNAYPKTNKHMYKLIKMDTFDDGTNPGSLNLRTVERLGTSERNRYWNDPVVRSAAERKRYRMGHRTTTTTQRYVMACCIALVLKSYRKMCMQHVYSTHVRDLHKTIHFTCKAVVYCPLIPSIGVSSLI